MSSSGMLRRLPLVRTDVFFRRVLRLLVNIDVAPSLRIFVSLDDGRATFLRNVGSYKTHTV
jgi:hypothetical protein